MLVIRILRFVFGYMYFSAHGGFAERFINLCAGKKIPIWDVKYVENGITAYTTASAEKLIYEQAEKAGMIIEPVGRHGIPYFIRRYRFRFGVAIGLILTLVFTIILSSMVWYVRVEGYSELTEEQILNELEAAGLKPGVFKSKIDVKDLQMTMLYKIDQLSWISVNINGSTAVVEVRERKKPPEIIDTGKPSNIVAGHDGEIIKLEVYQGEGEVEEGSAVVKGDLLISGVETLKTGKVLFHRARGSAIARTERDIVSVYNFSFSAKKRTSEKLRYSIYFFGLVIPLAPIQEADESYKTSHMLMSDETVLPLGIIRERFSSYSQGTLKLTKEQLRLLTLSDFYSQQKEKLSKVQEKKSSKFEINMSDSLCKVKGSYVCVEEIGVEKFFEVVR